MAMSGNTELNAKIEALFDFQILVDKLRGRYTNTGKNYAVNSGHHKTYHGAVTACCRVSDMLGKEMDELITEMKGNNASDGENERRPY